MEVATYHHYAKGKEIAGWSKYKAINRTANQQADES